MTLLLKKIICLFTGHPCRPTGRRGFLLVEQECLRCGGIYIQHPTEYGDFLVPYHPSVEPLLRERQDYNDAFPDR